MNEEKHINETAIRQHPKKVSDLTEGQDFRTCDGNRTRHLEATSESDERCVKCVALDGLEPDVLHIPGWKTVLV